RGTISAIARLPFDGERIFEMLRETEPLAAENPNDSDHTTFWLVLADQFQRRGIACDIVTERALALIDSGADAELMRSLGMADSALRKRKTNLAELRGRLASGTPLSRRGTIKQPQPLLMNVGGVYLYPTSKGDVFNPYVGPNVTWYKWSQDAWSALLVV